MSEVMIAPYVEALIPDVEIAAGHLRVRNWQEANTQNRFTDILDSQADLNNIDNFYIQPGGNFFLAHDSTELVGFVGMQRVDSATVRLKRMAVMPEHHRKGIGKLLVGSALEWATSTGIKEVVLTTGVHENARPLYMQYGFLDLGLDERQRNHSMSLALPA